MSGETGEFVVSPMHVSLRHCFYVYGTLETHFSSGEDRPLRFFFSVNTKSSEYKLHEAYTVIGACLSFKSTKQAKRIKANKEPTSSHWRGRL